MDRKEIKKILENTEKQLEVIHDITPIAQLKQMLADREAHFAAETEEIVRKEAEIRAEMQQLREDVVLLEEEAQRLAGLIFQLDKNKFNLAKKINEFEENNQRFEHKIKKLQECERELRQELAFMDSGDTESLIEELYRKLKVEIPHKDILPIKIYNPRVKRVYSVRRRERRDEEVCREIWACLDSQP